MIFIMCLWPYQIYCVKVTTVLLVSCFYFVVKKGVIITLRNRQFRLKSVYKLNLIMDNRESQYHLKM